MSVAVTGWRISGRLLGGPRSLLRQAQAKKEHLLDLERAGESGLTPFILIAESLVWVLPVLIVVSAASFAAYYLA
jgi:hypothetical protein